MCPARRQSLLAQSPQSSRPEQLTGVEAPQQVTAQDMTTALTGQTPYAQLKCPDCESKHFHRHGQAHGLQRYRCAACGRTFNALTGTPLARLHHKEKWLAYSDCLQKLLSIRKAAEQVDIHRNTSFRWRHRFSALANTEPPQKMK